MPAIPLKSWNPNPDELIELVFQHVDDSMLREIAAADSGMDFDVLTAIETGGGGACCGG